jgi:hypothetical protein
MTPSGHLRPPQLAASFMTALPTRRTVFSACQTTFDVIDDLLADLRQRKQFGFNERIVGLLDKFPTRGNLIP